MTNGRQRVAFLVAVGRQSMAEREASTVDAKAIEAVIAAGVGSLQEDVAEAIRTLMEESE